MPNRQPFAGIEGGRLATRRRGLRCYADIAAAFDPPALRAPLEVWSGRSAADAVRFGALSMFFSRADIALIDRRLNALSAQRGTSAEVRLVALSCIGRAADGGRFDLDCEGPREPGCRRLRHGTEDDDGGWIGWFFPAMTIGATALDLRSPGTKAPGR